MARRRGGGSRKQGIVSWLTSLFALLIGFFPIIRAGVGSGGDMTTFVTDLNRLYNPLAGDREALKVGYGALIGGIVFKVVSSELAKRVKMRSLIPALHA